MSAVVVARLDWRPPSRERRARNRPYLLAAQDPQLAAEPLRTYRRRRRLWLDQGREGACTGFAAAHVMTTSASARWRVSVDDTAAREWYRGAQHFDEWAGEDYEGSSVLGVMEYLRAAGTIGGYWWATDADDVARMVRRYGACEVGSWWYAGMFQPDADGWIAPTGSQVGGHAYSVDGWDSARDAFHVSNSWGRSWGVDGGAWLRREHLAGLLRMGGEAALPRRTAVPR